METKPRILYLQKILLERTDEENPLSTTQLINILNDEYGQFEQNKEKFGGLFYFYKERIMEDIDAMKVDLPL